MHLTAVVEQIQNVPYRYQTPEISIVASGLLYSIMSLQDMELTKPIMSSIINSKTSLGTFPSNVQYSCSVMLHVHARWHTIHCQATLE